MSSDGFNWHAFLGRWQEEWVPRTDADQDEGDEQALVPLGGPGATPAPPRLPVRWRGQGGSWWPPTQAGSFMRGLMTCR
ncbi:hypothetical protein KBY55_35600 [Streptomyces sp. b94]|uniref:hypothetical protein n=1 Tax=Streptomyces sp. b94 TaxID=1827634 RepID=UPI001B373C97|nr:hypothetical protein [Streptomyces sp. b94]MBQ1101226.1 hypothetical protein [Streptomyces sp. b94]